MSPMQKIKLIRDPLLSIMMLAVASWICLYSLASVYSEIRDLRRMEDVQRKSPVLAESSIVDKR